MRTDKSSTWPLRYNVLWNSGGRDYSREFTYEGFALRFARKKLAGGAKDVRIHDKVNMATYSLTQYIWK